MVLTLVPIAAVATQSSIKNKNTESLCFSLIEFAHITLFKHKWILIIINCNEALSVWGFILLLAKVDRPILEMLTTHSIVLDEFLDSFDNLNVCLLLDCFEIKLGWCLSSLYFLDGFGCLLLEIWMTIKTFVRSIQRCRLTCLLYF